MAPPTFGELHGQHRQDGKRRQHGQHGKPEPARGRIAATGRSRPARLRY
ncbi:hypothetical protein [Streptomyces sp. NPDC001068]